MRFIITAHPAPETKPADPDAPLDETMFTAYMRFNEEMFKAGVLVAAEGLNPAGRGAQVAAKGGKRVVTDGPFAETKELVGGFYILEVNSLEEAIDWALRCPTGLGFDDMLDIRPLTGIADLPPEIGTLIRQTAPEWTAALWSDQRNRGTK
jgi:hypothetical protein